MGTNVIAGLPEPRKRPARLIGTMTALLLLGGCSDVSTSSGTTGPEDSEAFSDAVYVALVRKFSSDDGGSVDYAAWQSSADDMAALDEHIAAIARFSPRSHPGMFPSGDAETSYWINAYNALVIDSVLDLWPLESVRDVRVSLTSRLIPGKGFFYDREIVVGGQRTNLLNLEQQILRDQQDPRLHFALNCASDSCPVLRASAWSDAELDVAAREFINNPANVSVQADAVHLSSIFKWYRKEFPQDLYSYLRQYADDDLPAQLATAFELDLPIRYVEYDWSLNVDD